MNNATPLTRNGSSNVLPLREISFTFQTNQSEMAAYPRVRLVEELTTRISECGDDLHGKYNVIVGVAKDHPIKFFWKPYAPGTRGRGFYLGPITEDGIDYAGRCYTLQSPRIGELSEAIDATVDRIAPPPKKSGPKKFTVVSASEPNPHVRFLTGFAELLARAGSSTIAIKDSEKGTFFSDLMRLSYGCADEIAQKAQVQSLVAMGLLRQVPNTKDWLKLYGFGQSAREHLPEQFKSLAGVSLTAQKLPLPEAAAIKPKVPTRVTPLDTALPSIDLRDHVLVFAKAQKYKNLAATEKTRADVAEASLTLVRAENSSLQAQIQNFDHQVEARARAMLDQMIKDL